MPADTHRSYEYVPIDRTKARTKIPNCLHHRIILERGSSVICDANFTSGHHLLLCLRDAGRGHGELLTKAGILYRDISCNNIVLAAATREDGYSASLIDLEPCPLSKHKKSKKKHPHPPPPATQAPRTLARAQPALPALAVVPAGPQILLHPSWPLTAAILLWHRGPITSVRLRRFLAPLSVLHLQYPATFVVVARPMGDVPSVAVIEVGNQVAGVRQVFLLRIESAEESPSPSLATSRFGTGHTETVELWLFSAQGVTTVIVSIVADT
ncbi:hypothetical protein FN846DRAFT_914627 [Sphaerosporella brunnea]|uniref:Fungal-type protein kinase domain-containing protein n=1 Tax=Sphaerosporella brunnea TaxID=1250544 RepID=A0A5J5ECI5_9PEZI|nr:hypothetical protein FN846DRAFT_914627 [Sphaerosporella brunnea]